MEFVLQDKENNKVTFNMEITAEEFEKAVQGAYIKNRSKFNIQGFRKGKAPRKLIEVNYGEGIFYEDAINSILPDAYENAIEELKLEPVDNPEIDIETLEKDEPVSIKIEVIVKPEVILGQYKGIQVEKVEYNVTDEDVDRELKATQEKNARIIDASDRETKEGDILNINYEGFVDEEQFEGGTAENQELEIGSNTFIPGFEEQLIGKKKGDSVDVNVTFPDEYHSEELKSKEAVFKVLINEVKEKELPELDDEFAKDISEFDTLEEYKNDIRDKLEKDAESREKAEFENNLIDILVDSTEIDVPEVMIEHEVENEINEFNYRMQSQGLTLDQYLQLTNSKLEDLKEQIRPTAEKRVKVELIYEAIDKNENIEVTDEDIDNELEKIAKQYNQENAEEFKENMKKGDLTYLETSIKRNKIVDLLVDNAEII